MDQRINGNPNQSIAISSIHSKQVIAILMEYCMICGKRTNNSERAAIEMKHHDKQEHSASTILDDVGVRSEPFDDILGAAFSDGVVCIDIARTHRRRHIFPSRPRRRQQKVLVQDVANVGNPLDLLLPIPRHNHLDVGWYYTAGTDIVIGLPCNRKARSPKHDTPSHWAPRSVPYGHHPCCTTGQM